MTQRNSSHHPLCDAARLRTTLLAMEREDPGAWFEAEDIALASGMHISLVTPLLHAQAELAVTGEHDVESRDAGSRTKGALLEYRLRRAYLLDLLGAYITQRASDLPSNRQTHAK